MFEWLKRYWHTPPADPKTGLPNFGVVVPGSIYRSGAPTDQQLRAAAAEYGLASVLDLRREGARRSLPHGLESVELRLMPLDDLGAVDAGRVEVAAQILSIASNHPILVHCEGGRDRTGAVVALFRVLYQHWLPAAANAEAQRHGLYGDSRHKAWADYVQHLGV